MIMLLKLIKHQIYKKPKFWCIIEKYKINARENFIST